MKEKESVCAVLLAGGKGLRFWPLSQKHNPKQFLKIFGKDSLLTTTFKRIKKIISLEKIYIVTNKNQSPLLKKELAEFNASETNILFEPEGKNTLPAIAWAAIEIAKYNPEAILVVLPCDHSIKNLRYFYSDLKKSIEIAKRDRLVIFGIRPKRAEIGYGYIQIDTRYQIPDTRLNYYKVERFIEKPNLEKAKALLRNKNYFWNSGIFVFKVDTVLEEIRLYCPSLFKNLMLIKDKTSLKKIWPKLESISLDVGVLEKTKNVVMLPAHFDWQDLGSWQSFDECIKKDKYANAFLGNCKDLGSRNVTIYGNRRPIITLGLQDLIIVDTEEGLLVSRKNKVQDIKKIILD